jgi:hypothetical protein
MAGECDTAKRLQKNGGKDMNLYMVTLDWDVDKADFIVANSAKEAQKND